MAWIVVRGCAVSIALALAGGVVRAQAPESVAIKRQATQTFLQKHPRITSLLRQLAEQARASKNLAFAVRAQSQAAALLWTQDPEQARVIYRRAFQSLSSSGSTSVKPYAQAVSSDATRALTIAEKRQLRSELVNQIAARDPVLAEELARELAESADGYRSGCGDGASPDCSSRGEPAASVAHVVAASREAAERRELLMSAALQIVERDPQQAMAFAQMSVALGLSPNLSRLLTLLRNVDAERADLLFLNAMDRLQQSQPATLSDIHTLGTYIVSAINSTTKQPLSKTLVVRFLNFAVNQITQNEAALARSGRDESAALYFIGRQLTDISARYGSDQLDQLQLYMSEPAAYEQPVDLDLMRVSAPSEIARDARQSDDEDQRDSLYARAALAWLAEGDVREAHAAALKIKDQATRDRVLIQVARRYAFEKRIDDGVALARRISDPVGRVDVFVILSDAAMASKDKPRAIELLSEAEACSIKSWPSVERARSLVKIASSFSALDAVRGFEALESAIKAINEIIKQQDSRARPVSAPPDTLGDLCSASLENTLTALAQADFERALILAQQLSGEEAPVIAQLAVLRGGLAEKQSYSERSTSRDDVESGVNH